MVTGVIEVFCKKCGAKPFEKCTSRNGTEVGYFHVARELDRQYDLDLLRIKQLTVERRQREQATATGS